MPKLSEYRKTIAAVITGVIGWASAVIASPSGSITSTEWLMLATIVATAAGVYAVPNTTGETTP